MYPVHGPIPTRLAPVTPLLNHLRPPQMLEGQHRFCRKFLGGLVQGRGCVGRWPPSRPVVASPQPLAPAPRSVVTRCSQIAQITSSCGRAAESQAPRACTTLLQPAVRAPHIADLTRSQALRQSGILAAYRDHYHSDPPFAFVSMMLFCIHALLAARLTTTASRHHFNLHPKYLSCRFFCHSDTAAAAQRWSHDRTNRDYYRLQHRWSDHHYCCHLDRPPSPLVAAGQSLPTFSFSSA